MTLGIKGNLVSLKDVTQIIDFPTDSLFSVHDSNGDFVGRVNGVDFANALGGIGTQDVNLLANGVIKVVTTQINFKGFKSLVDNAGVGDISANYWVSNTEGGVFSVDALVWSPIDDKRYKNTTSTNTDTDPSLDATNWVLDNSEIVAYPIWLPVAQGKEYGIGQVVMSPLDNLRYTNRTGTNTASDPSTDTVNWIIVKGELVAYPDWQPSSTGKVYAIGDVSISPIDKQRYSNRIGTNTDTDPSTDTTNWIIQQAELVAYPTWQPSSTGKTYAIGAISVSPTDNQRYNNITGTNTNIEPSADPTNWALFEVDEITEIEETISVEIGVSDFNFGNVIHNLNELFPNVEIVQISKIWVSNGMNFPVSGEDSNPTGITIGSGFFWVVGTQNDRVYQYSLGGVFTGFSFSVAGEVGTPSDIQFRNNFLYVLGGPIGFVFKYELNGDYTGVSFSVTGQDPTPTGLTVGNGFFWITGLVTGNVYQYTIEGVFTGFSFPVSGQDAIPQGIEFAYGFLWVVGSLTDTVYQYNLSGTFTGVSFLVGAEDSNPVGLTFNDGFFWMIGTSTITSYQYSPQFYQEEQFDVTTSGLAPTGITVGNGFFWIMLTDSDLVSQFTFGGIFTGFAFTILPLLTGHGITFGDGRLWVINRTTSVIIPFSVTGSAGGSVGSPIDTSGEDASPKGVAYVDGFLWVVGANTRTVYQYDIITGDYTGASFSIISQIPSPTGIDFIDGYFWVIDDAQLRIFKYTIEGIFTGESKSSTPPITTGSTKGITHHAGSFYLTDDDDDFVARYLINGEYILSKNQAKQVTTSETFISLPFTAPSAVIKFSK